MSVCTGRTPRALELLSQPENIEIALPIVCFMELHKTFAYMRGVELKFTEPFQQKINQLGPSPNPHVRAFAQALASADAALVAYLDESQRRLPDVVRQVAMRARLIATSASVLSRTVKHVSDPTDDMILGSIIEDASASPVGGMAFFTEDARLMKPSLKESFEAARVEQLSTIDSCLAWCNA